MIVYAAVSCCIHVSYASFSFSYSEVVAVEDVDGEVGLSGLAAFGSM